MYYLDKVVSCCTNTIFYKAKDSEKFKNSYLNRNSKKAIMNYLYYQKYTTNNNMF
jgi:hypothetical protein